MSRKKSLSQILIIAGAVAFALIIGEAGLRLAGMEPGFIPRYDTGLKKVDHVYLLEQDWVTDGEGVFRANPEAEWLAGQINSAGFRSIEFEYLETDKKKVLFLGDSFTWGVSAQPVTNCFADLTAAQGFVVYNTGIPGTDPNQYAYLAEKYIPVLKPDYTAVMFFMGNDFVSPRPMLPHKNLHHITDAGWMYAFDDEGGYMESPVQAYEYWKRHSNWLYATDREDLPDNPLKRLMIKSVIGSYAWFHASPMLARTGKMLGYSFPVQEGSWNKPGEHTIRSIERIRTACEKAPQNSCYSSFPRTLKWKTKTAAWKKIWCIWKCSGHWFRQAYPASITTKAAAII